MSVAVLRSSVFWFRIVSLLVAISLALGFARLTWRLTGWDDGRRQVWTPTALTPVGGPTDGGLAAVLAWAPFGGTGASVGDLPLSNRGLSLRGVVYVSSGDSTALIASGAAPVRSYRVGETPIGGVMIESIAVDRVVLNANGVREALLLPRAADPAATGAVAPASTPVPSGMPPGVSAEAQAALAAASPIATAAAAAAAAGRTSPAPTPAPARPAAPSAGALGVSLTPQGYVVGADSAPQLLRAGLRAGDLVKSVNGQALGDAASDPQILQRAAAGGRAQVEIVRDGRSLTLTVPLR